MPDYQELYLHLMRETEKAIRILVQAQRDCEELYLRDGEPEPSAGGADGGAAEQADGEAAV